jgi:DtxR family transcriptional regulator, Mn-dependent transcriptional regulator
MITEAIQDYLKVIYKVEETGEEITTNAIAERLQVTQPSVTGMVKKLSEMNLISYTPYQEVRLTEAGRKIALEVIRHHRLLELYLAKAMGYSWDRVHEEAEKLEHVISEEFEEKMAEMLGQPTSDPHGAPIPGKDGSMEQRNLTALTEVAAGQTVLVKQVSDRDPEKLRYLAGIGIHPEVILILTEKAPFGGPISIQIGETVHFLGAGLTDIIFVTPTRDA